MYIEEIAGSNIFSYDDFKIKLNKFNVLIGPNASGKSNFIEIIIFLKDILRYGLQNAINIHGDTKLIRNVNISSERNLSLKFKFECEESFKNAVIIEKINENSKDKEFFGFNICDFYYELEIEFENNNQKEWRIFQENLTVSVDFFEYEESSIKRELSDKLQVNKLGNAEIELIKNKDKFDIKYNLPENLPKRFEQFVKNSTFRTVKKDNIDQELESILKKETLFPILIPIIKFIENISVYKINKSNIIKSEQSKSKKRSLKSDGSNLKWVIDKIIKDENKKKKLIRLIRDFLPFIDNLYTKKPTKDTIELNFSEIYNSEELLPFFLMSDGTIDITIFIILLFFEKNKNFIIFEEPMSNIHPQLISKLVNLMKEVSGDLEKQLILTTHNPEIIKYCKLEDIMAISRNKKGFSEIYRPTDKEEIEIFIKNKLGINDLFIENLL